MDSLSAPIAVCLGRQALEMPMPPPQVAFTRHAHHGRSGSLALPRGWCLRVRERHPWRLSATAQARQKPFSTPAHGSYTRPQPTGKRGSLGRVRLLVLGLGERVNKGARDGDRGASGT
eukprot:scaffold284365_cov26-Tisochrysis_lutea.AAC.1